MSEDPGEILKQSRTIAVVGLSPDEWRDSHRVARYLQSEGYRIIPVNPIVSEVLGERAYPTLRDIPEPVDLVDVFRRSEFIPEVVDDVLAIRPGALWLQLGIWNEAAVARARAAGIPVVVDRCTLVEHRRLSSAS